MENKISILAIVIPSFVTIVSFIIQYLLNKKNTKEYEIRKIHELEIIKEVESKFRFMNFIGEEEDFCETDEYGRPNSSRQFFIEKRFNYLHDKIKLYIQDGSYKEKLLNNLKEYQNIIHQLNSTIDNITVSEEYFGGTNYKEFSEENNKNIILYKESIQKKENDIFVILNKMYTS